jgi:hypothetical protein
LRSLVRCCCVTLAPTVGTASVPGRRLCRLTQAELAAKLGEYQSFVARLGRADSAA